MSTAIEVRQEEATRLLDSVQGVSVIVADPPYGVAYHSNYYVTKNPHAPVARDWNFQIGPFLSSAARALVEGGAIYLFSRWDVAPLWVQQILPPLKLKNQIVWVKDNWSAGDLAGNFGNQYEVILFMTKGRHLRRGHRWSNVWECSRIPAKALRAPTEKPVSLLQRAIEASSDVGDLVVDPFCGSGSTGEAARACGRRALLGDIDPAMIRVTCDRLGVVPPATAEARSVSVCPVFQVEPPAPHLWGLHPEDLVYVMQRGGERGKAP